MNSDFEKVSPTDMTREASLGRIQVWLDPEDIRWLMRKLVTDVGGESASQAASSRIRFRMAAALHKSGERSRQWGNIDRPNEFVIENTAFVLRSDSNEWCRVFLRENDNEILLGAETLPILVRRFENAFQSKGVGAEPEWCLTLAEEHHCLYKQITARGLELFIQNSEAREVWRSVVHFPELVAAEFRFAAENAA